MKQFTLRQGHRSYLRRKNRQRTVNRIISACKLMAISLMAIVFLFYPLDMGGTHTFFTADAQLGPLTLRAGEWEVEEEEVEVWVAAYEPGEGNAHGQGNTRFNTRSNVTIIIMASGFRAIDFNEVNGNEVKIYMEYGGGKTPEADAWEYEGSLLRVFFENKPGHKELGKFFEDHLGVGGQHTVWVSLYCQLAAAAPIYIGECSLDLNIPGKPNLPPCIVDLEGLEVELPGEGDPELPAAGAEPAEDEEALSEDDIEDGQGAIDGVGSGDDEDGAREENTHDEEDAGDQGDAGGEETKEDTVDGDGEAAAGDGLAIGDEPAPGDEIDEGGDGEEDGGGHGVPVEEAILEEDDDDSALGAPEGGAGDKEAAAAKEQM